MSGEFGKDVMVPSDGDLTTLHVVSATVVMNDPEPMHWAGPLRAWIQSAALHISSYSHLLNISPFYNGKLYSGMFSSI